MSFTKMIPRELARGHFTIVLQQQHTAVVSDHGVVPTKRRFEPYFKFSNVTNILEKAGLTASRTPSLYAR